MCLDVGELGAEADLYFGQGGPPAAGVLGQSLAESGGLRRYLLTAVGVDSAQQIWRPISWSLRPMRTVNRDSPDPVPAT